MKQLFILFFTAFSVAAQAQLFKFQCEPVERYPEFPGGDKALVYYLRDTLSNNLLRKGIPRAGEVTVHAQVKETGLVSGVNVKNSPNLDLEREITAMLINMPRWAPAVSNGMPVSCDVVFNIDASGNATMEEKSLGGVAVVVNAENKDHASPQVLSRLAGVMQDFLLQKLPAQLTNAAFNGSVSVRFGMYPDGWVGRIKALKSDNKKLEEEVTKSINLFNAELAENRVNFKDELMRTFIATVHYTNK